MNAEAMLKAECERLDGSLSQGKTLPANWYRDSEIFELEKEKIFNRSWHCAGRVEQLAKPGDYLSCKVGTVPIVLLRDEKNELKGFVNVCRHRGAEMVPEGTCGNRKTIGCVYHAWTWSLDGQLLSAPHSNKEACFAKNEFPLVPVKVAVLGPHIFVNADSRAPDWYEVCGELPEMIRENGTDFSALQFRGRRLYEMKANWKVVVENYLECYHCPLVHKGFTDLIDLNNYHIIPYKYFSVQRGSLKPSAQAKNDDKYYDVSKGGKEGFYTYLWPNFMLNIYPGLGNVTTHTVVPVSANRTVAVHEFFHDASMSEGESQKLIDFLDVVKREDIEICESVQRGLESKFYHQGRLVLAKENGIQHFQRLVHSALQA